MKILGFEIKRSANEEIQAPQKKASYPDTIIPIGTTVLSFDGERNLGEMGPAINYIPNYYVLSTRSWQAYADAPLAKAIIDKWVGWILDTGLKIKTNPSKIVLKSEGIELDKAKTEQFNDIVESRWDIWANSKLSSFSGEETFNELSKSVYINSKISGDCLVVLRYIDGMVKVQYIDGARISNPNIGNGLTQEGNIMSNGVEISPTGRVIRYHIRMKNALSYESIPAYSSATGMRMAFLVKGSKWRLDYHRGLPIIATALETLTKMDKYHSATVSSAEEVAKIAYQVVHQNFSDGSSPLQQNLAKAFSTDGNSLPSDDAGNELANRIAVTTNKSAFNNPKGAEIKTIQQSNNLQGFGEFYGKNADIVCAMVGIPPNVALSVYNDSFSASRAATKDWDHTIDVQRDDFTKQCLMYVYKFWLYTEILKNKIPADGYLQAVIQKNYMITESYEQMRMTGPHFPHIDPLKEVKAEREKLGALGKNINLTTVELATEALGGGDSDSNVEQFADEIKMAESFGLVEKPKEAPQPPQP